MIRTVKDNLVNMVLIDFVVSKLLGRPQEQNLLISASVLADVSQN